MAILLYSAMMLILYLTGIKYELGIKLKHGIYTSVIAAAVCLPLNKIIKSDSLNYGTGLLSLYGINGNNSMFRLHWGIKIASFLMFAAFPVFYLSLASAGYIEITMACMIPVTGFLLPDFDLRAKIKKKKELILAEYPVFCTDIAVLAGSGMEITEAWKTASGINRKGLFYKEARTVAIRTETGVMFVDALREFAAALVIPEIYTFVTIISQELKSGSGGIAPKLTECAKRSWKTREAALKKRGGEAAAKLVFPLAVGLAGILLILAAPAVMIMKGM